MKKSMIILLVLVSVMTIGIKADYLRKGAIVCQNPDAARHIVQMNNSNDPNFFTHYDRYVANRVCADIIIKMTLISTKKLSGGISKVVFYNDFGKPQSIYALTQEIRKK